MSLSSQVCVASVTVLKGYGFVQFGTPDDAQEAIERENSTSIKGRQLILKPVNQARGAKRGGRPVRGGSPPAARNGPRAPGRGIRDSRGPGGGGGGDRKRLRRSSPWNERSGGGSNRPFQPSFSRSADVEADRTVDCELVVLDRKNRHYANEVESRLRNLGLTVDILVPPMGSDINQVLDQISSRGSLYAIVFRDNCEMNRCLSLYILHYSPPEGESARNTVFFFFTLQPLWAASRDLVDAAHFPEKSEYRNMRMDDAMTMVARSFETFQLSGGGMSHMGGNGLMGAGGMAPISASLTQGVAEMLEMVRQDQRLSTMEYNHLIRYLEQKREYFNQLDANLTLDGSGAPKPFPPPAMQQQRSQQHMELQQKILSIMQAYKGPQMGGIGASGVPRGIPAPGATQNWANRRF